MYLGFLEYLEFLVDLDYQLNLEHPEFPVYLEFPVDLDYQLNLEHLGCLVGLDYQLHLEHPVGLGYQ